MQFDEFFLHKLGTYIVTKKNNHIIRIAINTKAHPALPLEAPL